MGSRSNVVQNNKGNGGFRISHSFANSGGGTNCYVYGLLDEYYVWNKALTDSEAVALYNDGFGLAYYTESDSVVVDTTELGPGDATYSDLLTDLVSVWKMDESGGNRYDFMGLNNLSDRNTVGSGVEKVSSKAADFESSNQEYLEIYDQNQSGLDIVSGISIAGWIKIESFNGHMSLVSKGDSYDNSAFNFTVRSDGGLWAQVFDSPNNCINSYSFSGLAIGNWYHVAMTWNATASDYIKLYVNGSEINNYADQQTGLSFIRNSSDPLWVGKREYNGSPAGYYDGKMEQMCIWSRELSADEINLIYNNGNGIPYDPALFQKPLTDFVEIPTSYALHQNFPNPFNPITTIRYDLPEDSRVVLTVYNVVGQKIAELVNSHQPAGYHSIQWDAGGFPSGVYIYQMNASSFTEIKKMVIIK